MKSFLAVSPESLGLDISKEIPGLLELMNGIKDVLCKKIPPLLPLMSDRRRQAISLPILRINDCLNNIYTAAHLIQAACDGNREFITQRLEEVEESYHKVQRVTEDFMKNLEKIAKERMKG